MRTSFPSSQPANSIAAILVDEVGIETGVIGDHRIKTAYRPVYRRLDGLQIVPFAVEGLGLPHLAGQPVDPVGFAAGMDGTQRSECAWLSRTLGLRNLRNLGTDTVSLLVDIDLADFDCNAHEIETANLAAIGLVPERIVCVIPAASLLDRHDLVEHTLTLRADGCGISVSGFGAGPWDIACLQAVRPDIVQLDATWFRRVSGHPAAAKLLVPLIAGLHDQGADVLVRGIADPAAFQAALDCGADLFAGGLFGQPRLAGAGLDTARLSAEDLLGGSNVVPLFGS